MSEWKGWAVFRPDGDPVSVGGKPHEAIFSASHKLNTLWADLVRRGYVLCPIKIDTERMESEK